ncbi:serine/threonine protein kinase [Pendulispora brunnea]|uniref:Serine/threonine protein kinase n=1 Tax=Pendulispora brunnea TaxID=2905690 RepID=A0ABZ2JWZ6_9BACT
MSETLQEGELFLDKYRIERLIGKGGMGAVYAAVDTDLARRVAIKVLLAKIANMPQAVTRFINEGRAAARIEGEHVARVFAAGHTPNGLAYMVLEYLDGMDLAGVLRERPRLPIGEAVDIVLETLEAVAEAHRHGIVHRDLKPGNLFLARKSNGQTIVKVLDFGISKATNPLAEAGDHALTSTKATLGSPLYMSPEQLRSAKNVDRRSDIWSIGVILYEMLTGTLPFRGEALGELFAAILEQNPAPIAHYRPDVPQELQQVIYACLQRDPQHRFPEASHLAQALAPFAWRARGSVERVQSFSDATISQPNLPAPAPGMYPTNPQAWTGSNAAASTTGGSTGPSITSPAGLPPKRSMLALVIGIPVVFVVAGSILAIFFLTRTKTPPASPPVVVASGTATATAVANTAAAAIPAPPATEEAVAEKVKEPEAVDAGEKTSHSSKRHRPRGAASASSAPAAADDGTFDPTKATRK